MTDKNDKQPLSFKEQILADLEEAVRQRRLREAAALAQEKAAKEEAKRLAELERQRLFREEQAQVEAQRQATEEQARLDQQVQQELQKLEELMRHSEAQPVPVSEVSLPEEPLEKNLEQTQLFEQNLLEEFPEQDQSSLEETQILSAGLVPHADSEVVELDLDELDEKPAKSRSEDETQRRIRHRQQNNKIARKISGTLVSLILIGLLVTSFLTYRYVTTALQPVDAESTEYVQVEIPLGSGNKLIGKILEEAGVIKSSAIFNYYTKFKNYSNFQSGYYNIQKSMDLDDIAKLLQEGGTAEPVTPALGKILIPEGYTLEQIAEAVAVNADSKDGKASPYKSEDFLDVVQNPEFIAKMVAKYPTLLESLPDAGQVKYQLEGYLFPATYAYYEGTTIEDIVDQMLGAMDGNLAGYYDQNAANGMSVNDLLTLASLVEKEGSTDDDRKAIASVFYNRLNMGMPLQSNIAILYAMGSLGQKTTLKEDATINTEIDSPYNIYKNPGLMPGPVDSPSLAAIEATVYPADTDYLYFVADVTTGAVYYTADYNEHLANVEKYVNSKIN